MRSDEDRIGEDRLERDHLFADRVEFNTETKDVLAEGNVVIQVRDEVIRAERVFLNLATGQGRVEKAVGMVQPSLLFSADRIDRRSDELYGLSRARLTTCTQPTRPLNLSCSLPPW